MTFKTALANSKLIYSVLNRAGITQKHPNFEDYFQDCLLIYVALEEKFANKLPTDPVSREAFFYVRMYCQLVDQLRHENYHTNNQASYAPTVQASAYIDSNFELVDLADALKKRLTAEEYRFLELAYACELPLDYICRELNVSRRTVFRFQKKIRTTIEQLTRENC
ncbi:sigma-70 RNA polymerase sigma factor region 4 domain-containing protein [Loigolactobacillus zhaoyuanensis]|uniref:Sigma-70 family RNA polymerase sigma factor n=1 Tax=Loigolactobacillus zhaoyuanensis TaxID=2486017 RepID=A0ABW8UCQ2_9LACO|nr:sigma-70 family RNA polymerase sigma factor [Loigolactobacillus zhaoyuanensis]